MDQVELNDLSVDDVHKAFIPKEPVREKYFVEFEGSTIYIDSLDWRNSIRLKIQIIVSLVNFVLFGLAEQSVGTLIPILQKQYHVNDMQTACIFLSSISGYILMGMLNGYTHDKVGLKGILMIGTASMALGYGTFSTAPPFFILVVFATCNGIGCGVLDAACNTWIGSLVDSNQILGLLHGCYGLGSMLSPSLISYLIEREVNPWKWNQYYLILCGLALSMFTTSFFAYKYETAAKYKYVTALKMEKEVAEAAEVGLEDIENNGLQAPLGQVMKKPLVWVLSSILFIYVGAEVGFGAWLISFLTRINHLPFVQSSHIATTFWCGLMMGRTTLGFVTAHYFSTELTANFTYISLSVIGYTLFYIFSFTKFVPLIFIIVAFTGYVVGPIFQTTIVASIGILPSSFHTSGVGFICAIGGSGAAGIPFLVGVIAQSSKTGLRIYPLVILGLYIILWGLWLYILRRFRSSYKKSQ